MIIFGIIIGIIIIVLIQKKNKKKSKLVDIKTNKINEYTTQISIELNEEEIINRIKKGDFDKNLKKSIDDIAGFYGLKTYSSNKIYCITRSSGHFENEKWINGKIALIKEEKVLFKKELERPNDCVVSNDGIVICCDWLDSDELIGKFYIFDNMGNQLFSKQTNANLGCCELSLDSKIAIFETHNSNNDDGNKIFIVDIENKKLKNKVERKSTFGTATINTKTEKIRFKDHRNFIYEMDFNGNQTNFKEYENQILNNGSINDKLSYYENIPIELKIKDQNYLDTLNKAITDKDSNYSFGLDMIYRKIGEFYEDSGNIIKTIEFWEKAIQINPKIGVKRKLNSYKKQK